MAQKLLCVGECRNVFEGRTTLKVSPDAEAGQGRDAAEAIEVREAKVRQLKADARRLEVLPLPSANVRRHMREQIAAIAALGAPSAARLMTGGDIAFHQTSHRVPARLISGTDAALVNWEMVDIIIAVLDADITARARDAEAMGRSKKKRALAAVADRQLALDREIVELVFRAIPEA